MACAIPEAEEEAIQILNLLEEVGLVGPKLSLSLGDEEKLTRQLTERLGLQMQAWHVEFVKGQVRAATQLEDIDRRLGGIYASPSMQRLEDAIFAAGKAPAEESSSKEGNTNQLVIPMKGTLGKSVRLRSGRVVAEDEIEGKVLDAIVQELHRCGAPILSEVAKAMNPARATKALLGKYRVSTLTRYLASWQRFMQWAESTGGATGRPSAVQLMDYLYAREEEGMGPSIPLSVARAVGWFESLAGWEESTSICKQPMVDLVVKELTRKLEGGAPPVKRAPRWLAFFFRAMEEVVMDELGDPALRRCAWMKLVKAWASMRHSDMVNLRTGSLRYYDGKLAGSLYQTKTTGAGKRVRELPIFIGREAHVAHQGWLGVGYELVKEMEPVERDWVFQEGVFHLNVCRGGQLKYAEAVAASAEVLASLSDGDGNRIIPQGWERFWTEHSERATLASGLAAIGIKKDERDLLGRWQPEGSDQYVRTYNAVVGRLQRVYAETIRRKNSYEVLDEGSIMEDLKLWLVSHWAADAAKADGAVEAWKVKLGWLRESRDNREVDEGIETPTSVVTQASTDVEKDQPVEEADAKKRRLEAEEDRQGGYVIVYRRAGRGTLHRLDASACWMARKRGFQKSEIFSECPEPLMYSMCCKLCWPAETQGLGESTSDSCDEVDLED